MLLLPSSAARPPASANRPRLPSLLCCRPHTTTQHNQPRIASASALGLGLGLASASGPVDWVLESSYSWSGHLLVGQAHKTWRDMATRNPDALDEEIDRSGRNNARQAGMRVLSSSRTERLIMRTCALCGLSIGPHGWLEGNFWICHRFRVIRRHRKTLMLRMGMEYNDLGYLALA